MNFSPSSPHQGLCFLLQSCLGALCKLVLQSFLLQTCLTVFPIPTWSVLKPLPQFQRLRSHPCTRRKHHNRTPHCTFASWRHMHYNLMAFSGLRQLTSYISVRHRGWKLQIRGEGHNEQMTSRWQLHHVLLLRASYTEGTYTTSFQASIR